MRTHLAIAFIICNALRLVQLANAEDNIYETDTKVYYIEPQQKFNWSESVAECKTHNMALVTLDTEEKTSKLRIVLDAAFLDKQQPIPKLYIDANDIDEFRKHIWAATGAPFSYTNWEKGEPNNYQNLDERCVHLGFHGTEQWNDINCSRKYGFICELSKSDYEFAKMAKSMAFA